MEVTDFEEEGYYYGTDRESINDLIQSNSELGKVLHPALPYTVAEIIWAVNNEWCLTLEDALSRRTRALLLDAKAAIEIAPEVAALMAKELKKDSHWISEQLLSFNTVAQNYLPKQL